MSYAANVAHVNIAHESCDAVRVREHAGLLSVAMSDFVVVIFMRFLMTARDIVTGRRFDDARLKIYALEMMLLLIETNNKLAGRLNFVLVVPIVASGLPSWDFISSGFLS